MVFTREDAARAAQNIGIDFKKEAFQLEDLLNGMNTELARHGTKAGTADVTAAADGLMAAADKSKLDGMSIATDSEVSEMLAEVYGE